MNAPTARDRGFEEEALPLIDAVYRFALRLSKSPDRAQDLTRDTFLRGYQNWEKYTPGTPAKSWLFTICRNLFLRREERKKRHDEIVTTVADKDPRQISREATVFLAVRDRDPEGEFWGQVVDDEVLAAIDELPDEFREAVARVTRDEQAPDELRDRIMESLKEKGYSSPGSSRE